MQTRTSIPKPVNANGHPNVPLRAWGRLDEMEAISDPVQPDTLQPRPKYKTTRKAVVGGRKGQEQVGCSAQYPSRCCTAEAPEKNVRAGQDGGGNQKQTGAHLKTPGLHR